MDEEVGSDKRENAKGDKLPRRAFILTENTVVYVAEANERENTNQNHPSVVNIQSHLPVDIRVTYWERAFRLLEIFLATVTFVVVVWYMRAAYLQVSATQEATAQARVAAAESVVEAQAAIDLSKEQFQRDQRPYIWKAFIKAYPYSIAGPVRVDIFFANFGKTPALRVSLRGDIFFGANALKDADKWFASLPKDLRKLHGSVTVIPPGVPAEPEKDTGQWTTLSKVPSAPEYAYTIEHDSGIVAVSREQYEDASGKIYETDLCFFRLKTGAMAQCERHNEIR